MQSIEKKKRMGEGVEVKEYFKFSYQFKLWIFIYYGFVGYHAGFYCIIESLDIFIYKLIKRSNACNLNLNSLV